MMRDRLTKAIRDALRAEDSAARSSQHDDTERDRYYDACDDLERVIVEIVMETVGTIQWGARR